MKALFLATLATSAFAVELPPMLDLPGTGGDADRIDYAALPLLKGEHAVVCPYDDTWKFQLHNYLLHHEDRFWCMWSAGPVVEDYPTQHVRYATSDDGLHWSAPKNLTGMPAEGRAYIARDFWLRDGELLALAASYKGHGAFGVDKDLQIVAFAWNKGNDMWTEKSALHQDAINNFSPQKISTGEWMMTRRDARFNVTMLFGGMKSLSDWRAVPVVDRLKAVRTSKFSPDEPVCWEQPDGTLIAAIRDNGGSGRLYRTVSTDHGATWSESVITNYPNATSKLFTLKTSRGYRVLVSNANPRIGRREMHLAVSDDGITFTRMMRLDIPSPKATTFQYPHVIEHECSLFIAFSNKKNVTEVLKVKLDDLEKTAMPASVGLEKPLPPLAPPASAGSDWIDLGNEGETLYLTAELTVPKRGQTAALSLATSSGLERAVIGIDAAGKLTAKIHPNETKGAELKEGEALSLLVRIIGHKAKQDEMFVQTGPAGSIPAEPKDGAWTLINSAGNTQANLAVATTTSSAFKNVRIAASHAALASSTPIQTASVKASPALDLSPPHPVKNPGSALMLAGSWLPQDTHRLDFDHLPQVPSQHAIVNSARHLRGHRVNQHNYLVHHAGRFWAMWSDGPGGSNGPDKVPHHDLADQHVAFASSPDGLTWNTPGNITGKPDEGYGWIARGFWQREGRLLALASRYHAPGYAGPGLSLHAFELADTESAQWKPLGMVFDDTLNNFSPILLPSGEWMMNRRDGNRAVHFLRGGVKAFDDWKSTPMLSYSENGLTAEEPDWWVLPDGNLCALFRDNANSGCLFRAFSTDEGRTWTKPVRTNFPDAKSKFSALRLKDGRYALVSNPRPGKRDPLTLAISDDGLVFTKMLYLVGGRHIDYPHIIEQGDSLYIAFNTLKQTCEVLKVKLSDVDAVKMPEKPLVAHPAIRKREFIYDTGPYPQIHASSIVETPTGLVSAWFGGTREKNPDVCIYVSRQMDGKWTESIEVANGVQPDGTRHPTWNPVLFQPREGPLLLFYKVGPDPRTWWGELKKSTDGGQNWSAAQRLPQGIFGPIKNKPVQLANGDILCPTSNETDEKPPKWSIYFERTSDLGKTWTRTELLHDGIAISAIQPSILHLGGDKLQAVGRTRQGKLFQITSEDVGKTWGEIALTELPNPNSGTDAVTLADGRHLLIYNHTEKGRSPLNLAVSKDGQTWQAALVLEDEPKKEFSYPTIIQTRDGFVHITYTWQRKKVKHIVIDPLKLTLKPMSNGLWPE